MQKSLIFVYNADSSIFSQITDYAHKIISPKTYACNLCKITYGNLGEKKEWKEFIKSLNIPVRFLHRDEFKKEFPDNKTTTFPIAFSSDGKNIDELISTDEIESQKSFEDLINLVKSKTAPLRS